MCTAKASAATAASDLGIDLEANLSAPPSSNPILEKALSAIEQLAVSAAGAVTATEFRRLSGWPNMPSSSPSSPSTAPVSAPG